MRPRPIKKLIAGALVALVLGSLWFVFAPVSVGGSSTWVVTDGISMEPRFHAGDLVLVRAQSHYHVGEIVAYNNKQLHTIVLHRIVGRDGSRYIFKGDNNNFLDFEHPAQNQLIGALWLHFAGLGGTLESLHSPVLIGAMFALATLLFAGAAFTGGRRRRRRQRRADGNARPAPAVRGHTGQAFQLTILAGGLVALLPFVCLALLAFTRPAEALLHSEAPYEQHGTLSYTAQARPGLVYPGNVAHTGDPLFTHVVNHLAMRFDYRFEAAAAHRLSGKIAISATVQSVLGWRRTIPLGAPTSFQGDHGVATANLEISALLALIHSVETSTGERSTYMLTLTPSVVGTGSLDGLPLHATFAPAMAFSLNQLELQPIAPGQSASSGLSPASAFTRSAGGSATGRRSQAMQIYFGIVSVPVATARAVSLIGISLIACIIGALLALAKPRGRDESAVIRARYGGLIIPVDRVWQQPGVAVIDVADIEALVRIAGHYDRSILYERTDDGEAFWVTDESGQFRYWIGGAEQGPGDSPVIPATVYEEQPTLTLELPGHEILYAEEPPTLEFTVHAGTGAQPWGGGWESSGHSESVARAETASEVEPGPLVG